MLEINNLRRARLPLERKRAKKIGHPSVSLDSQNGTIGTVWHALFSNSLVCVKNYLKGLVIPKKPGPWFNS